MRKKYDYVIFGTLCLAALYKFAGNHDLFELASFLLSLHSFEDDNCQLGWLLYCYPLIRDGLPFPSVLTLGIKRLLFAPHHGLAEKPNNRMFFSSHLICYPQCISCI